MPPLNDDKLIEDLKKLGDSPTAEDAVSALAKAIQDYVKNADVDLSQGKDSTGAALTGTGKLS